MKAKEIAYMLYNDKKLLLDVIAYIKRIEDAEEGN